MGNTKNILSTPQLPNESRIAKAKEKLRQTLSYEKLKTKAKYKHLTKEQYNLLINNIEKFTFLALEVYFSLNTE